MHKNRDFPIIRTRKNLSRKNSGNMLVFIVCCLGLALSLILFGLNYVRFLGSYQEQKSAIDAASMAAAKAMGRIVISDPNFGYVGLSDSAPSANGTVAGDNWDMPVTGINTLFGTIRLDLIISDNLQDPVMNSLAMRDYNRARTVQTDLVAALQAAATPNGTGNDAEGKPVNPTQEAIDAYNANVVRLTGKPTSLAPDSLRLTLGYVDGLTTQTLIPQPTSVAQVQASENRNGYYLPNKRIDYTAVNNTTVPFVFASVADKTMLVDFKTFSATVAGVPFSTPAVVKCEADENYVDTNEQGVQTVRTVHAVSASEVGVVTDSRPQPGMFTISFPNGMVPEVQCPGDLINSTKISADPTDALQSPRGGDYPNSPLTFISMPFLPGTDPNHPAFRDVFSLGLYDWLRRGGTRVNVQAVINMLNNSFVSTVNGPQIQQYHMTSQGAITNDAVAAVNQNLCVSQNQYRAISGLGLKSENGSYYDLQITDYGYVPGNTNGGKHGGEPLDAPGTTVMNSNTAGYTGNTLFENPTLAYQSFTTGPAGGGPRPTYITDGIGLDYTLRKRPSFSATP